MEDNNEKQDDLFQSSRSMYEGETSQMKEERETRNDLDKDTFGTSFDNSQNKEVFTPGFESNSYTADPGQNYYTGTATPVQTEKKGSKALEICALVFGIISLCGCCYGLFGIIGLVLSIIALATGKKSGLSIAGLICSILGVLIAILVIVFYASSYGKEFMNEFRQGFESGYESSMNDGDSTTEYTDTTTSENNAASTVAVSSEEASVVVINGKQIKIPCTVGELDSIFTLSAENENTTLEGDYSDIVDLEVEGLADVVSIYVVNDSADEVNISEGKITGVWVDMEDDASVEVSLYNGVKLGMSKADLEAALSNASYDFTGDDSYASYQFSVGNDEEYYYTIYLSDGAVDEVSISYYGLD